MQLLKKINTLFTYVNVHPLFFYQPDLFASTLLCSNWFTLVLKLQDQAWLQIMPFFTSMYIVTGTTIYNGIFHAYTNMRLTLLTTLNRKK